MKMFVVRGYVDVKEYEGRERKRGMPNVAFSRNDMALSNNKLVGQV